MPKTLPSGRTVTLPHAEVVPSAPDPALHLRIDARTHPDPAARVAAWADAMSLSVETMFTREQAEGFEGSLSFYPLGPALLVDARCTPHTMLRTRETITRSGDAHILLDVFTVGGFRGVYGGKPLTIGPGDCFLMDFRRTLRVDIETSRFIGFVVPRGLFEAQADSGLRFEAGTAEASVLGALLEGLAAQAARLSAFRAASIGPGLVALVDACIRERNARSRRDPQLTPKSEPRLAQVLRYVERHAADPGLDISRLCAAFGLSRTALYRLCRSKGGVAEIIRQQRAKIAHHLLIEAGQTGASVESIARASGFSDSRSLRRALRDLHDASPSQLRKSGHVASAETLYGIEIGALFDATRR